MASKLIALLALLASASSIAAPPTIRGDKVKTTNGTTFAFPTIAGAPGQVLWINPATQLPEWVNPNNISRCHGMDEDFVLPAGGKWQLTNAFSGTGATVSVLGSIQGHMGRIKLVTGTTSSGTAQQIGNANYQPFRFDSATFTFEWIGAVQTLSDGTDTFGWGTGLVDMDVGVPIPVQAGLGGAFFRQTSGTNSGKIQACTANAGPANTFCQDTGVAMDTGYHRYTIVIPQQTGCGAACPAAFYVDGALNTTSSTFVPSSIAANMHWRINKSLGTTSRELHVDAYSIWYCYGTPR
jgi:hypothetical protein